jgi:regulatory protein
VDQAEIDDVVAVLAEAGAVDDEGFARRYASDKRLLAGWGADRIEAALQRRGVAREHIDAALAGEDEEAQFERATSLLLGRGMSCDGERERERALGLLVRRGFPLELAYDAVRAAERRLGEAA